jgi:hypothetical protein
MSNLPLFIIISMCIGLGIIILISKSETGINTTTITTNIDTNKDTNTNLVQKPELTDKPASKRTGIVVDIGYTTK